MEGCPPSPCPAPPPRPGSAKQIFQEDRRGRGAQDARSSPGLGALSRQGPEAGSSAARRPVAVPVGGSTSQGSRVRSRPALAVLLELPCEASAAPRDGTLSITWPGSLSSSTRSATYRARHFRSGPRFPLLGNTDDRALPWGMCSPVRANM